MLSQLNEYTPIFLQHLKRPIGTPLMAGLQADIPLLLICQLLVLIQRNAVAKYMLVHFLLNSSFQKTFQTRITYSFIHTASVLATLPLLSTAPKACFTSSPNASVEAPTPPRAAAVKTLTFFRGRPLSVYPSPLAFPFLLPLFELWLFCAYPLNWV